jgi:hypothetical protein
MMCPVRTIHIAVEAKSAPYGSLDGMGSPSPTHVPLREL